MKCPICPDSTLAMTNRQGIEIDYCPNCRGVWLDRGELDKIIERAAAETSQPMAPPPQAAPSPTQHGYSPPPPPAQHGYAPPPPPRRHDDDDDRRYYGHQGDYYHKRKRKGLLGELFDFD